MSIYTSTIVFTFNWGLNLLIYDYLHLIAFLQNCQSNIKQEELIRNTKWAES